MNATIKPLRIESKIILGKEYTVVKGWAAKGFSIDAYREQVEAYGQELVYIEKLAGDKVGNVYDIILA